RQEPGQNVWCPRIPQAQSASADIHSEASLLRAREAFQALYSMVWQRRTIPQWPQTIKPVQNMLDSILPSSAVAAAACLARGGWPGIGRLNCCESYSRGLIVPATLYSSRRGQRKFRQRAGSTQTALDMYDFCRNRSWLAKSSSYTTMLTSKFNSKLRRSRFALPITASCRSTVSVLA